jgi:uncharacterized repeat protein (TIGR03803 family)
MAHLTLVLKGSDTQNRDAAKLVDEQNDPQSPNFQKWISPKEFGERFGPSAENLQTVTDWLAGHGLVVDGIASGRHTIDFHGTVSQVEEAFQTEMHNYEVQNSLHMANAYPIVIPEALAPIVSGVTSLAKFPERNRPLPRSLTNGKQPSDISPETTINPNTTSVGHYLSPADFKLIYNIPSTGMNGEKLDGAGQTIAIIGTSDIDLNDVSNFQTLFGLPSNAPFVLKASTPFPGLGTNASESEGDLDVEWAGAVAPGATIVYVNSSYPLDPGLQYSYIVTAVNYAVNHTPKIADILSVSFGKCERSLGASDNAFFYNSWLQAVLNGTAVVVSSGDAGSADCDVPELATATQGLAVNGMASTPFNVAVGGTRFCDGSAVTVDGTIFCSSDPTVYWASSNGVGLLSAQRYIPEAVWNESELDGIPNGLWAGGGGRSSCALYDASGKCSGYPKPSWQFGVGVPQEDGVRDLPDISLAAAEHNAYLTCQADKNSHPCVDLNGTYLAYGTSAGTPAFAGILALLNQYTGTKTATPYKNLYAAAAASSSSFNDILKGTNAVPCTGIEQCNTYGWMYGYAAGPRYDLATGLGTPNVAELAKYWLATSPSPQLRVSPQTGPQTTTFTLTATGFTAGGSIQPYRIFPSGAKQTLALVTADGTGTASWTDITQCSDVLGNWSDYAVDVVTGKQSAEATFTITANSICNPISGSTYTLTVNSSNPFNGAGITVSPADNTGLGSGTTGFSLNYNANTQVTLIAPTSAGGNAFSSWTGCDQPATGVICKVTMTSQKVATANYTASSTPTYTLTVNSLYPSSGVEIAVSQSDNDGLSDGTTSFVRTYNSGTQVTLTAPSIMGGNAFSFWTGCDQAVNTTCTVTLTAGRTVTAFAAPRYSYSVLQNFCTQSNCTDGADPNGGLIQDAAGNLYGTTQRYSANGKGNVFKVDITGHETVLYSFCTIANCTDGNGPQAGLIQDGAGNLYGTTISGGANGKGNVFKLDNAGHGTVIYSFCSVVNVAGICIDGEGPGGDQIQDAAGNLYGTTFAGGTSPGGGNVVVGGADRNMGTVFEVDTTGHEAVLYNFCAQPNCTDGALPNAGLIRDVSGNLFGTTTQGGAGPYKPNGQINYGGTVFKVDNTGHETVLYSFCSALNCTDGSSPVSGVIQDTAGNVYGTTQRGGANGNGTVFKVDSSGHETVLYSFCAVANCADGEFPVGTLIQDGAGNLYGIASLGGASGHGTVFRVDSTGHETVLYSFCSIANCTDGNAPQGGLVQDAAGNLYGTTAAGGIFLSSTNSGNGIVFKLSAQTLTQQTINFTSPGPLTYGVVPFTLIASASSGLPVSFAVTAGAATVSSGTLTITGAGLVTVQATQIGNSNYAAATPVSATFIVSKATPSVTTWPTASSITYGQTLASSTLTGGASTPAGTFAFTTPTTAPGAGTASQSVTFTPTDATDYTTLTGTSSVTVNKATSSVTAWPTASAITYGQTLASSTLSGGASTPAGSFAFTTPTTAPGAGTASQSVTFTPTDTTDYSTLTGTASVTVNKATSSVTTWPTASAITYGQPLASSTLSGGASTPAGSFAFTTPTTKPGAGTASQSVTFMPTDVNDYSTLTGTASVTVNKATPSVTTWPTASAITYGQPLASSTLSGGASTPAGSFAFTTPTTAPGVGAASQSVTFTPTDASDYSTLTGTASVTVNKATPSVTTWPTASSITYGQTLASSTLSGGASTPAGSFAFTTPTTAPGVGTASQSVTFAPTDATDYSTLTGTASVMVSKASSSTALASSVNPSAVGQSVNFTATVTGQYGGTATGSVTFSNGSTSLGSVSLSGGTASVASTALPLGTDTITAVYGGDTNFNGSTSNSVGQVVEVVYPAPILSGISPAFTNAGGAAFTLTVTGSGFASNSTVYWGTTALVTTYGTATQLTAQVPATDIAAGGTTAAITVQTPSPGGGTSNPFQFEVNSASGSTTGPTFTSTTATVTVGSSASYPVTLPSSVESAYVTCLNLPTGATCSYSATTNTLTITTSSTTPKGTYQITVVFTETVSGAASGLILLPFLLLPLMFLRRKLAARGVWVTACLGLVLLAGAAFSVIGCGGGGGSSSTPPPQTHQVVSSGTVTLTVQ